MAEESKRDISSQLEFLSMAARLAKVNMNEGQTEFMFLVAELLISKGEETTMKEILAIKKETEVDSKKRAADKKKATVENVGRLEGGAQASWIESNTELVKAIHNRPLNGNHR